MKTWIWSVVVALLTIVAVPLLLVAQDQPLTGFARDSIQWFHIRNAHVVASKTAITSVTVNVSAGQSSGAASASTALIGGTILGIRPSGNQDQHVDNVTLNGSGVVTVTLAANATAQNNFVVTILRTRP